MLSHYTRAKFRVKIRSLAEEARIIRHEEARALHPFSLTRAARKALRHGNLSDLPSSKRLDATYRVIAKHGDSLIQAAAGLRLHRIGILRDESRATALAYAFARGVPDTVAERGAKKEVNVKRILEIVRSMVGYGDHFKIEVTPAGIIRWTEEAKVAAA